MDMFELNHLSASAASPPLLRAFALAVYTHAHRQLEHQALEEGDKCIAVRRHTSRLKLVKQLLVGLQVHDRPPLRHLCFSRCVSSCWLHIEPARPT